MNIKIFISVVLALAFWGESCKQVASAEGDSNTNYSYYSPVPMPEIIDAKLENDLSVPGIFYTNRGDSTNLFFVWEDSLWTKYPILAVSVGGKELNAVPLENIGQITQVRQIVNTMFLKNIVPKEIISTIYHAWESSDGEDEYDWPTELLMRIEKDSIPKGN